MTLIAGGTSHIVDQWQSRNTQTDSSKGERRTRQSDRVPVYSQGTEVFKAT